MPRVTWKSSGLRLDILPWVDGRGDDLTLHVTYRLKCRNPAADTRLIVAVRPFQVNPPWQAFRNLGGRSPIHQIYLRRRLACRSTSARSPPRRRPLRPARPRSRKAA